MNIIFLGAPGAGKGTCASEITKKYSMPHISTGDIFRANIKNNTELGRKAKSYIDKGQLVPDEVVIDIVNDRLQQEDCTDGYALDGFPRTIPQAKALDKVANIDIVINLIVPDEVIIKRLAGRRVCKKCGNISHIKWLNGSNLCDKCGEELYQRDDDKEETVKERLEVYYKNTAPLIEYYKKQNKLYDIEGEGGVEAVNKRVTSVLDKL